MFVWYVIVTLALAALVYFLRHTRAAPVLLSLATFSVCATALEAYYRFVYCQSDGLAQISKNFAEQYYRYDNYGLRASNLPLSDTQPNVVVLGDSHVFGAGLKSPSYRFSELLGKRYPKFHVVNLGYPGWDTKTELQQLVAHLDDTTARVQLVVLAYFFNDIEEEATPGDRSRLDNPASQTKPTPLDKILQRLSRYSRFVELFYFRIGYPRLVHDRLRFIRRLYEDPQVRSRHLATLAALRETVETRWHSQLLVVLLPYLHSKELLNDTAFYAEFDQSLAERSFRFIDMQPIFARYGVEELRVNRFDPHTNPKANKLIANAVTDYLDNHSELLR